MSQKAEDRREHREDEQEHVPSEKFVKYTVVSGDSLSKIAKRILGNGNRWPEIYALNKKVIGSNPDLIYPGQEYRIRTS